MAPKLFTGSCHCGRITFQVRGDLAAVAICNCSICQKKGFLHMVVATDDFELLSGGDDLAAYRFHTGIAKHQFCKTCGIHPFYVPRSDPNMIDVNVRCLDDVELDSLNPHRFDGENWEQANARQDIPWRAEREP